MAEFSSSEIEQQVMYRIACAPPRVWPFPHLVVEDVFPPDFYAALLEALPPIESYRSIADAGRVAEATDGIYRQRHVIELSRPQTERFPLEVRDFWSGFLGWLLAERFAMFSLQQFGALVHARFGDSLRNARFYPEFQLLRDFTDYSLGPHTDSPHKVMVLLFYLARDGADPGLGTSLYVPRDSAFRCEGRRHYPHADFLRVATMPYRPNTMLAFFKNARSFHGVEPLRAPGLRRDLIQLSICHRMASGEALAPVPDG